MLKCTAGGGLAPCWYSQVVQPCKLVGPYRFVILLEGFRERGRRGRDVDRSGFRGRFQGGYFERFREGGRTGRVVEWPVCRNGFGNVEGGARPLIGQFLATVSERWKARPDEGGRGRS